MQNTATLRGWFSGSGKKERRTGPGAGINERPAAAEKNDDSAEPIRTKERISLLDAEIGRTYIIQEIDTTDEEMNAFLFRLGCYSGEPITVISKKKKSCIVAIKDSRYGLDNQLAEAVIV